VDIARIVVGVDASKAARQALLWSVELARLSRAEVLAVHAVDLPAPVPPTRSRRKPSRRALEELREMWWEEAQDAFAEWCSPLWGSGIRYRAFVRSGPPTPTLVEVAESEGADLLVVGSGRRGITSLLIGSVSRELPRVSSKPVVLVPGERARKLPWLGGVTSAFWSGGADGLLELVEATPLLATLFPPKA
jgi:nucleotide-binding universal stress UspA family protein